MSRLRATGYMLAGAVVMAFVLTLVANPHSMSLTACKVPDRRYSGLTLQQKAKLSRCNLRHARGAIEYVRVHREAYNTRRLASLAVKVVAEHRARVRKALRNLRAIQDRIYFTGSFGERYRVVSQIICSFDWSPTSCAGAIQVSRCETGGTFLAEPGDDPGSIYVGLFELGPAERIEYGVGSYRTESHYQAGRAGAWDQVTSAHNMYVRNGRSWSRWACRPDGSVAY